MSKMLRNILIMIAMVVVAVGAIILTNNLGKDDGELAVEPEPTEDTTQHLYVDYSVDDIVDITVENRTGAYTLYKTESSNLGDAVDQEQSQTQQGDVTDQAREQDTPQTEEQTDDATVTEQTEDEQTADEQTVSEEQTSEEQAAEEEQTDVIGTDLIWKLKGNEQANIDQSDAASIARYASYVYIEEVITEDMSRKSDFGLEDYTAKVTVKFTDGTTQIYYYGNQVPGDNEYYMYIEGVDKVFTVSTTYGYYSTKSSLDLYALNEIGIASEDISEIKLERDGKVIFHTAPAEHVLGLYLTDIVEPFQHFVNSEKLTTVTTEIADLSVNSVVDGSGNFDKYGLGEPWGKLTIISNNGYTAVFMVGDKLDDTYTACAFEGDKNIYKIYTSSLDVFNHNTYEMMDKYLAMLSIENVDKVTFSGFGFDSVALGIEKEPQYDENGDPKLNTDGEQVTENVFYKNGEKLAEEINDQGTWYYQALILTMSSTLLTPDEFSIVDKQPVGSMVFYLSIDPGKYTVDFYEYNEDFYVASINGQNYLFQISDNQINKLLDSTDKFLKGEIERPY